MPTYEITVTRHYTVEAASEDAALIQLGSVCLGDDSADVEIRKLPHRSSYDFGLRPRKEIADAT